MRVLLAPCLGLEIISVFNETAIQYHQQFGPPLFPSHNTCFACEYETMWVKVISCDISSSPAFSFICRFIKLLFLLVVSSFHLFS